MILIKETLLKAELQMYLDYTNEVVEVKGKDILCLNKKGNSFKGHNRALKYLNGIHYWDYKFIVQYKHIKQLVELKPTKSKRNF